MSKPRHRLPHEIRVTLLALLAGAPAVALVWVLLFTGDFEARTRWTLALSCTGAWLAVSLCIRQNVERPLQTLANLLKALHEGDYAVRARGARHGDALGEVFFEINTLGGILQSQRRDAREAAALLGTVISEIDVAIFAFDDAGIIRLANPFAQELLGVHAEGLLGRAAKDAGIGRLLEGAPDQMLARGFFGSADAGARWNLRRTTFRERGHEHTLVVLSDIGQILREEELAAWQRLVRVLGHELNNSLAPIKSIAESLVALLAQTPRATDWEEDMRAGLSVIASRANGLARFMQAYAQLARLPPPNLAPSDLSALICRIVALERRMPVHVDEGPSMSVKMDSAQIEQALINLLMNAIDASTETGSDAVRVTWRLITSARVAIEIEDNGPGIASATNLFVPFFTTKQKGTGIGLVLARRIAENHGGSLTLENRQDGCSGCIARLSLPL